MPSRVKPARRKGLIRRLIRHVRLAAAFMLSAMLSYCSVGDLTGSQVPQQEQASVARTAP